MSKHLDHQTDTNPTDSQNKLTYPFNHAHQSSISRSCQVCCHM